MVSRQIRLRIDPNKLGRGSGVYYHRGHGYYSKYSESRDKARRSYGWKLSRVGLPRRSKYAHVTDGVIKKYWSKYS